ncbi:hypothetical protein POTOM_048285 [Populus tomentosa]|uniref:Uncharacterized protein n=1 Tax=Populus tomentosa TaxID=118781 RepID=A0A8X7YE16_POPTO|nr:hypothetical protein POTOM_048285 [Populus tomentosa]
MTEKITEKIDGRESSLSSYSDNDSELYVITAALDLGTEELDLGLAFQIDEMLWRNIVVDLVDWNVRSACGTMAVGSIANKTYFDFWHAFSSELVASSKRLVAVSDVMKCSYCELG